MPRRPTLSEKEHDAELSFLRATPGGRDLSAEMLELLTLLIFDDYELFPTPAPRRRQLRRDPN